MTKLSKKNQKRLAKLVSMALMCAGGLCSLPSVASAEEVKEVTWDGSATGSTPTHVTPADAAMGVDGHPAAIYAHITNTYGDIRNITEITKIAHKHNVFM